MIPHWCKFMKWMPKYPYQSLHLLIRNLNYDFTLGAILFHSWKKQHIKMQVELLLWIIEMSMKNVLNHNQSKLRLWPQFGRHSSKTCKICTDLPMKLKRKNSLFPFENTIPHRAPFDIDLCYFLLYFLASLPLPQC